MQMHRLYSVGRWMVVAVVVAACGCTEGEWNGLNKSASKDKPVTKARRPVKSEPAVAEANKQPEPPADDAKSREVDEKVERYVHTMEPQYDPSYQNNDFSSKIQRQSDPDRAARVRQTAIRSRTEPTGDESGAASAEEPTGEPAAEDSQESAQIDKGAGDGSDENRREPVPDQTPAASHEPTQGESKLAESSTPPNPEKPSALEDAKTGESAMKPPVLSQVTIAPSPTPVETEPLEKTSASPSELRNKSADDRQVEAATSNDGFVDSTKAPAKKPIAAEDPSIKSAPRVDPRPAAEPVRSQPISPAPPTSSNEPAPAGPDHNTTEAASNESVRMEAPVEEPSVEVQEPKLVRSEPAAIKTISETAVVQDRPAANTPPTVPPATEHDFKKKLLAQETVVAGNPDDVEEQFKLRMMYLVDGQDEKAMASSPSMNADTQEIMLGQIRAMMAARSSLSRDPAVWANQQLEAMETLRGLLRAKADLLVPRVELCKAIEAFGQYEPIEPRVFASGVKNRVLIYIEVDNFQSDKSESGLYRTLLSVRASLLNKSGEELWHKKDDNIEDLARRKRRDFYLTIGPLAIPKSLAPGEYVFKVEVEDVLGGKINSNVVRFKMVP